MAWRVCFRALRCSAVLAPRNTVGLRPIGPKFDRGGGPPFDVSSGRSNSASLAFRRVQMDGWRRMSSGRVSDNDESDRISEGAWLVGEAPEDQAGEVGSEEVVVEEDEEEGETQETPPSALDLMMRGVPRRRRRFLMQKALKMPPESGDDQRAFRRGFEMKVIDVNRTVKVTKGGKVQSFTALVITGNRDGAVGFGKGKASEVGTAVDKASLRALSNLHYFERFHGHTIFHEHYSKFEKTKIYLWPGRAGTGMRASRTVGGILRLAGYRDVKSKVIGSRHPLNTVKAVFKTLSEIESPEEVGERRGRIVVESDLVIDPS